MITKGDILKMASRVSRRSRNIPDGRLMHPEREWSLALIVFVLLFSGIFVLNAERFSYFNNIEEQLSNEASPAIEYKHGTMQEVLDNYGERARRFQELRHEAINSVDSQNDNAEQDLENPPTAEPAGDGNVTAE